MVFYGVILRWGFHKWMVFYKTIFFTCWEKPISKVIPELEWSSSLIPTHSQWYMVLNKRVQWVFFENILKNWFHTSSSLSNKKFRGLMVRRPAFQTAVRGSIPLAGSFVFSSFFFAFFLVFQKKASASGSVVQKPPIPTNRDCYLQNGLDSGYIFLLHHIHLVFTGGCVHRIQKMVFYLMNLLKPNRIEQNG